MTPKERAAMQQALIYLDAIINGEGVKPYELEGTAFTLREALAVSEQRTEEQAEQEPVAWMDLHKELGKLRWMGGDEGWDNAINAVRDRLVELAAPVRTKDLTDDEILKVWNTTTAPLVHCLRAVIAADREKNK